MRMVIQMISAHMKMIEPGNNFLILKQMVDGILTESAIVEVFIFFMRA